MEPEFIARKTTTLINNALFQRRGARGSFAVASKPLQGKGHGPGDQAHNESPGVLPSFRNNSRQGSTSSAVKRFVTTTH